MRTFQESSHSGAGQLPQEMIQGAQEEGSQEQAEQDEDSSQQVRLTRTSTSGTCWPARTFDMLRNMIPASHGGSRAARSSDRTGRRGRGGRHQGGADSAANMRPARNMR